MDASSAILLLQCHAFAHEDVRHHKMTYGFLGSLRPFSGELQESYFHELMAVVRALSGEFGKPALNRELIACLWSITHLARAWAVEPDGVLRRNGLIADEQVARMERWLDLISYAVMILLENGGEEEAFWGYREYISEQLDPLMAELDVLLKEKAVDADIQELHASYQQRPGADEQQLGCCPRISALFIAERTAAGMRFTFCTRAMANRMRACRFI